jgi:hypothetical protein
VGEPLREYEVWLHRITEGLIAMPFMILLLALTTAIAMWAFFHYNPHGVPAGKLMGYNAAVLLVAAIAAVAVGAWIFGAAAAMPGKEKFSWYLGIMAGGMVYNVIAAAGGFIRNFVVFPQAKRSVPSHEAPQRF